MKPLNGEIAGWVGCALMMVAVATASAGRVTNYNVVWDSPSPDYNGSMPLGNGDVAVNAWVEPGGDLLFYISKTDAWGDNARLLKIGKVRVHCDPSIVPEGAVFRQELDLQTGTLRVTTKPAATNAAPAANSPLPAELLLWVDANHPAVHVSLKTACDTVATASFELWRTNRYELPSIECSDVMTDRSKPKNMHAPTIVEPDAILRGETDCIGWYHHNIKSVGPAIHTETQGMTGLKRPDPLLHRTFGALIVSPGGHRDDDRHLQSPPARVHEFDVCVLTRHPSSPDAWRKAVGHVADELAAVPLARRRAEHEAWWRDFWDRSWIEASSSMAGGVALIPGNRLPMLVGKDQQGGNRFAGEIATATVYDRVLPDDVLATHAAAGAPPPTENVPPGTVARWTSAAADTPFVLPEKMPANVTLEAWVKPAKLGAGGARIIDKITPGASDGFLLDTYPGNSLRLIAGDITLAKKDCLPAGQWSCVAATVNGRTGELKLYANGTPVATARQATESAAFVVSRGYALQRFVNASAGRGQYPIKFNGTLFTVPHAGSPGDADYRRWGPGYWWQNTRLPYIGMCTAGDFDLMQPLFHMYVDELLPVNLYRTRHYFGHGGAYYIECIDFWGDVFNETYGWTPFDQRSDKLQQSGYHKWEWVSAPELAWMLLDYYDYTQDTAFLQKRVLPTADAVLAFFENHYPTNAAGQLVMHPAQALETWWDCTNPMPELAGLRAVSARLLALPANLTPPQSRTAWQRLAKKLPPLPTRDVPDGPALAPAERFTAKRNCENPELYAVFPFRLVSFEKPNVDLGLRALKHRWDRGHAGWRQDDVFMAYLGLADDARMNLVARARSWNQGSRFPAFWGPNYDWVPDQDHGGILMKTLQAMLIQTDGRHIYLLPAWPADWNLDFKVHAPFQTTVSGTVRDGKLVDLDVVPAERRADVTIVGPKEATESGS